MLKLFARHKMTKPMTGVNRPVIAIGDIHGRDDLLIKMMEYIDYKYSNAIEIYLGDLIDRGNNSKRVVEELIKRKNTKELIILKGNHEQLLSDICNIDTQFREEKFDLWKRVGGMQTILSYGLSCLDADGKKIPIEILRHELIEKIPENHMDIYLNAPLHHTIGTLFFVHAGIRPKVSIEKQEKIDLLNIRNEFTSYKKDHGYIVVHGHSVGYKAEIQKNRINLDSGAYATGVLSGLLIEDDVLTLVTCSSQSAGITEMKIDFETLR